MLPEIRLFPSDYFYQNKLIDSEGVKQIAYSLSDSITTVINTTNTNSSANTSLIPIPTRNSSITSIPTESYSSNITTTKQSSNLLSLYEKNKHNHKTKNHSTSNNNNNSNNSILNALQQFPTEIVIILPYSSSSNNSNNNTDEKGKNKDCTTLSLRNNEISLLLLPAVMFYDLKYSEEVLQGKSYKNDYEIDFIMSLLSALMKQYKSIFKKFSIGIISSYKAQVNAIKNRLTSYRNNNSSSGSSSSTSSDTHDSNLIFPYIEVNTVDGFQGKEKDIIIFSCVRTSERGIGFLNDEKRVNVAITRGKYKLFIIGKSQALETSHVWNALLISLKNRNYIQKIG